jgi:hypothetical protein
MLESDIERMTYEGVSKEDIIMIDSDRYSIIDCNSTNSVEDGEGGFSEEA